VISERICLSDAAKCIPTAVWGNYRADDVRNEIDHARQNVFWSHNPDIRVAQGKLDLSFRQDEE
jgi:hypothetical protein